MKEKDQPVILNEYRRNLQFIDVAWRKSSNIEDI